MVRKPLPSGYTQSFSQRFLADFFSENSTVRGEQLLKITPVSQVNKLLVQRFFGLWQAETRQLQSPYFDFNHSEVKSALKEFMNVLSRHISIGQSELAPLLQQAVQDAATLAQEPLLYFKQLSQSYPAEADFSQALKYLSWQPALLSFLKQTSGSAAERLQALQQEMAENRLQPEAAEPYLQQLHGACPLPAEFWEEKPAEVENFFSSAWSEDEPTPARLQAKEPAAADAPAAAPPTEAPPKPVSSSPPPTAKPEAPRLSASPEAAKASLNDKFSTSTKTPLAEKLKKGSSPNGSIRNHISLNQRFMFIKELFGGNAQAFNASLDELDGKSSLAEADHYVQRQLATQYNWPAESEAVEEFQIILEARFG